VPVTVERHRLAMRLQIGGTKMALGYTTSSDFAPAEMCRPLGM
jgi:hypothetical protein